MLSDWACHRKELLTRPDHTNKECNIVICRAEENSLEKCLLTSVYILLDHLASAVASGLLSMI